MPASVTLLEILGRSNQGVTRPFLCRGQDGRLYYVKGRHAGLRSLCCEWVAGRLAQLAGLSIPGFAIGAVPAKLAAGSDRTDIRELGTGPVFASTRLEAAREITWAETDGFPPLLKAEILLFDWWVQNEDRSLSSYGGNPNLLVTSDSAGPPCGNIDGVSGGPEKTLWVFDFNLAFDASFQEQTFRENHIFGRVFPSPTEPPPAPLRARMKAALEALPEIWAELPVEWLHIDGDDSLPAQLEFDIVNATLSRLFETDGNPPEST